MTIDRFLLAVYNLLTKDVRMMNSIPINYNDKFQVLVPVNWARKLGPSGHLVLSRSPQEAIVVRREKKDAQDKKNLEEILNQMRCNATKFQPVNNVRMSSVEPFCTPGYDGKIMTYAFDINGNAVEITITAFQTEEFFYFLILQAPVDCPHEVLNDYFDVVNSFEIFPETKWNNM